MATNNNNSQTTTGSATGAQTSSHAAFYMTCVDGTSISSWRLINFKTDTFVGLCTELGGCTSLSVYTAPKDVKPWSPGLTNITVTVQASFDLISRLFDINENPTVSAWIRLPNPLQVPNNLTGFSTSPCATTMQTPDPKRPVFRKTISIVPSSRPQQSPTASVPPTVPATGSPVSGTSDSTSNPASASRSAPEKATVTASATETATETAQSANKFCCSMLVPARILESDKYKVDPTNLRITVTGNYSTSRIRSYIATYNLLDDVKRRHAFAESMMHYLVNTGELNNLSDKEAANNRPEVTFDAKTIGDITSIETMIANRKKGSGKPKFPEVLEAAKRVKAILTNQPNNQAIKAENIIRRFGGVVSPTSGCGNHNYNNGEPALMVVCPNSPMGKDMQGIRTAERNLGNILTASSDPTVGDLVDCVVAYMAAFGESLGSEFFPAKTTDYLKIDEPVSIHELSPTLTGPSTTQSTTQSASPSASPSGSQQANPSTNQLGEKKLMGIVMRIDLLLPESPFYNLSFAGQVPEFVVTDTAASGSVGTYTKDVKDAISKMSAMTPEQRMRLILWTQFYFVRSMDFNANCYGKSVTEQGKKWIGTLANVRALREGQNSANRQVLDCTVDMMVMMANMLSNHVDTDNRLPTAAPVDTLRMGQIVVPVHWANGGTVSNPLLSLTGQESSSTTLSAVNMVTGERTLSISPSKCRGGDFVECLAFMYHRLISNGGLY